MKEKLASEVEEEKEPRSPLFTEGSRFTMYCTAWTLPARISPKKSAWRPPVLVVVVVAWQDFAAALMALGARDMEK